MNEQKLVPANAVETRAWPRVRAHTAHLPKISQHVRLKELVVRGGHDGFPRVGRAIGQVLKVDAVVADGEQVVQHGLGSIRIGKSSLQNTSAPRRTWYVHWVSSGVIGSSTRSIISCGGCGISARPPARPPPPLSLSYQRRRHRHPPHELSVALH